MLSKKVVHLTSAHPRYDTRIFIKICSTLAVNQYDIFLVVADGNGDQVKNGVSIVDVGAKLGGRLSRMTKTVSKVFEKAKVLDGELYHLHDPELIPVGLKLKKLGKKVVFDVHENIALQIQDKDYLPTWIRYPLSKVYRLYESYSLTKFDALVLAESSYLQKYSHLNALTVIVLNMPDLGPLKKFISRDRNKNELFYIGGVSAQRGFYEVLAALKILKKDHPDVFFNCIGPFADSLLMKAETGGIEENYKLHGSMPLYDGLVYSKSAKVGLSILKPIKNYEQSYSTKVFEYMAIGLPVITSDFPLYKDVVEKYECGLCVNPNSPEEIAHAVEYIFDNPERAKTMGENGLKVIKDKFNWSIEGRKLIELYRGLLN